VVEKSTKVPRRSSRKKASEDGTEAARARPASGARATNADPGADWTVYVAVAAYYRAERHGFAPGRELEDWLAAEEELEAQRATPAARRASPKPRKPTAAA
jgi:hypothetical protein